MPILGDLEHAVMDVLWTRPAPIPVRDVHEALAQSREIAYTTVMTVLDRLAKKGLVTRQLEGRAWLYRPALDRLAMYAGTVAEVLSPLDSGDRTRILSNLLAEASESDA